MQKTLQVNRESQKITLQQKKLITRKGKKRLANSDLKLPPYLDLDWQKYANTSISSSLINKRRSINKKLSEKSSAIQIATAIHEAIHFVYAAKHNKAVFKCAVANTIKPQLYMFGFPTYGMGIVADYNLSGRGFVESHLATAIFELLLQDDESPIAAYELKDAFEEIQVMFKSNKYKWISQDSYLKELIFDVGEELTKVLWPLVHTIAVAMLELRSSKAHGLLKDKHVDLMWYFARAVLRGDVPEIYFKSALPQCIHRDVRQLTMLGAASNIH